jgi:hypothetical protein
MTGFSIDLCDADQVASDHPCRIRIAAGDVVFTRLLRESGNRRDDSLIAPPAQLAFWLCDNWWRLRWEGICARNQPAEWRLAHDLSSIGGGYAWPRLTIWGDLDRIGLASRSDPVGVVGPVRYLTDALLFVDAREFELATDRFLDRVSDIEHGFGTDRDALRSLVGTLREEREDPEIAIWRRLEARLGYDPDTGPEAAIVEANNLASRFGLESVEEAIAASPGADSPYTLARELEATRTSGQICDFSAIVAAVSKVDRNPAVRPWEAAEKAAEQVRSAAGIGSGTLLNKRLADLLGVESAVFKPQPSIDHRAYGLRLRNNDEGERQSVLLRSRHTRARRFELCRALGDTLWARGEAMGPLATRTSSTARQRFQRAFAQSLLCPFDELRDLLGSDCPEDEDITEAATHFHVDYDVVRSLLVNKGVIGRESFFRLQGRIDQDRLEAA